MPPRLGRSGLDHPSYLLESANNKTHVSSGNGGMQEPGLWAGSRSKLTLRFKTGAHRMLTWTPYMQRKPNWMSVFARTFFKLNGGKSTHENMKKARGLIHIRVIELPLQAPFASNQYQG